MPRILKRPAAERDLIEQFVWFGEEAGLEVARRFLSSAEAAFQLIAKMPRIGSLKAHEGRWAGTRMWRVDGFESILIFYRPLIDGVAIERVLHAKRDYLRVLK